MQSENAKSPMDVRFCGSAISERETHPEKAMLSIAVIPAGMLTSVNILQSLNALGPMDVTPSGILMLARLTQ